MVLKISQDSMPEERKRDVGQAQTDAQTYAFQELD